MKLRFYLFAETVQDFGDAIKTVPDPVVIEEDNLKDRQPSLFHENVYCGDFSGTNQAGDKRG